MGSECQENKLHKRSDSQKKIDRMGLTGGLSSRNDAVVDGWGCGRCRGGSSSARRRQVVVTDDHGEIVIVIYDLGSPSARRRQVVATGGGSWLWWDRPALSSWFAVCEMVVTDGGCGWRVVVVIDCRRRRGLSSVRKWLAAHEHCINIKKTYLLNENKLPRNEKWRRAKS